MKDWKKVQEANYYRDMVETYAEGLDVPVSAQYMAETAEIQSLVHGCSNPLFEAESYAREIEFAI